MEHGVKIRMSNDLCFGIGARCCPVYTTHHDEFCSTDSDKFCKLQEQHPKPGPLKGIK